MKRWIPMVLLLASGCTCSEQPTVLHDVEDAGMSPPLRAPASTPPVGAVPPEPTGHDEGDSEDRPAGGKAGTPGAR